MACGSVLLAISLLSALVLSSSAAEKHHTSRDLRVNIGCKTCPRCVTKGADILHDHCARAYAAYGAPSFMLRLRGGAEVGKGDPRWIVSEREDGKNVGAWHWEERDMFPWAKKQLQGLLGLSSRGENVEGKYDVSMRVENITRLYGDAVIHLRKGKMWPLCDMQITASIHGECINKEGKTVSLKGEIAFEEVSMDEREDLQVRVSVVGSGVEHDVWYRWLRKEGKGTVVSFVQSFLGDLDKQASNAQQVIRALVQTPVERHIARDAGRILLTVI